MATAALQRLQGSKEANLLWIEDEPHFVRNYRDILERERFPIGLDVAQSLEQAARKIQSGRFAAVIVDCRMAKRDASANGAEFLLKLNNDYKALPTFVCTSYAHHQIYKRYLDKSYAIAILSKSKELELPLSKEPFFIEVVKRTIDYAAVKDIYPERIELSKYIKEPRGYTSTVKLHWQKHGHWISVEMRRRGLVWCVVCGVDIVSGSNDMFEFPAEQELLRIGEEHNLIPFSYSDPFLPEDTLALVPEDTWSQTYYPGDYYPTLSAHVGSRHVTGDFDTGAVQTIISDALVQSELLDDTKKRTAVHLGKPYTYFPRHVQIRLVDGDGVEQMREVPVSVVENWDESPFTTINGSRKTLFGRDLLRAFQLEVVLDSKRRRTRLRFLGGP